MTLVAVLVGRFGFVVLVGLDSFVSDNVIGSRVAVVSITGFALNVVALVIFGGQDPRNRSDMVSIVDVHDSYSGRTTALHRDVVDRGSDERATIADQHDLFAFGNHEGRYDLALLLVHLDAANA